MATARRARVCFSAASRRPRSAKTLPELGTTISLFFPFAISRLVILGGGFQSSRDQIHIRLSGLDSFRGLLLKRVQDVDRSLKLHRVVRPVCIASGVLHNFQNARAFALPRFRAGILSTKLRHAQTDADFVFDSFGTIQQIALGRPDPKERPFAGKFDESRHEDYPIIGIFCQSRSCIGPKLRRPPDIPRAFRYMLAYERSGYGANLS